MSRPILALAMAAFAAGTAEFVVVGLLPELANGMRVSIAMAGLLVSIYFVGAAVGGLVLAPLCSALPRRIALFGTLGLFVLGNLGCMAAPAYGWLLLACALVSLAHGALMSIAATCAVSIVPPEKRTQALMMVLSGLTLAYVFGVPLGTALGELAGWRVTFAATSLAGLLALVAIIRALPRRVPRVGTIQWHELKVLKDRMVLLSLLISVIASVSLFSVQTYMVPLLLGVTGISSGAIVLSLLVYGLGLSAGNWMGQRLANGRVVATAFKIMVALVVVLLLLALVLPERWITLGALFAWGLLSFALVPLMHVQVKDQAEGAPNLASTLNQSAFSLGGAIGALVGAAIIGSGLPYYAIPLAGAGVMLCNVGLARRVSRLLWRKMELEMMGPIDQPL